MDERASTKLWLEQWQRAAPMLERVRRDELRRQTPQEAAAAFKALAELACDVYAPAVRTSSGFADQQRLFQRLLTNGTTH